MIFIVFLIPIAIAAFGYWKHQRTITQAEFILQIIISCVVVGCGWYWAKWGAMDDVEHWNGRITQKKDGTESCCHCTTICDSRDSKGNCTSSHESCDHVIDYWWQLKLSTGDKITDGCNGWGAAPKWWTEAKIGEPASAEHSYRNYLKADINSLFIHNTAHKKFLANVPDTIPQIHGKYKANKVIARGAWVPPSWETQLQEINADLGRIRQVDLLVYVTSSSDPTYADAVEEKWVYGPKNALIVVLGVPQGTTIEWARVVTISKVEALKVEVRELFQGKSITDPTLIPSLRDLVKEKFRRTPLEEFSYLASAATPHGWRLFVLIVGAILLSVGLTLWMDREHVA